MEPAPHAHGESLSLTALQRRWQIQVLSATYLSYVGYYFCRKAYSVCKAPIAESLQLEEGQAAQLLAIPWTAYLFAYMVGQFVNGALGRKTGPRVLLLTGMAGTMLCGIGFGFANSIPSFTVLMALNGLFQSSGWPGNIGAIAPWIRKHERGRVMGLWTTNYSFGSMAVKGFVSMMLGLPMLITGVAVWRTAFWSCSCIMLVLWFLVLIFQRNKPEDVGLTPFVMDEAELDEVEGGGEAEQTARVGFFSILFTPTVLMIGATYFCLKFLRYAIDSWLPYMFNSQFELDYASAGYYSLVFDMMGIAGGILAGWALDKLFHGKWRNICLLMVLGMVGTYVLVYLFGGYHPAVLSLLTGFVGFMLFGPDTIISGAATVDVGGKREALAAAGIINGIGSIGPIVQEFVVARLLDSDNSTERVNILFLMMSCLSAVLLTILVVRARRRERALAASQIGANI